MIRNNLYLEKIIKKAIMEQDEAVPAPPSAGEGDVPPPPSTSQAIYSIVGSDGKTDPNKYTLDQLKAKNLTADSYIYAKSLGGWKMVKEVPEVNNIIAAAGSTGGSSAAPTAKTGENVTMDQPIEGSQKSFMEYCPNAKSGRDMTLKAYNSQMEKEITGAADVEEINTIYDKYMGYQGQFDKDKFLKPCMDELKVTLKGQPGMIQKFQSAFNQWIAKDGKEFAKKALSAGGNMLLNLANKTLKAKGLGTITENIIKKNTKNHLIEIYNRKNRRRY